MLLRRALVVLALFFFALPVQATTTCIPLVLKSPTVWPSPTPLPEPGNAVRIAALTYSGRDEFVRIQNDGPSDETMTGWRLHSVTGNQWFWFPTGYVLKAGASVCVHSGPGALDLPPDHLRWTGAYVWNNAGDEAELINDDDEVVDQRAY